MIQIQDLTLRVPGKLLVAKLNLQIESGQRWCILGKNGSGKSTLLRAIAGLPMATGHHKTGDIFWQRQSIEQLSNHDLACLRAYAEQSPSASDDWVARDVVEAGAWPWVVQREVAGENFKNKLEILIERSMSRCDALHLSHLRWRYLSGGERQRVALAACLAQSTQTLILDEPTAHLDLGHQFALIDDLVRASQSCKQILISSIHDLQLAARGFTHALILNADAQGTWVSGSVEQILNPEHIKQALGHDVTWATTEQGNKVLIAL